ncbi:MAG: hypothetical protein ACT4OX_03065 [Actinomycetota bacterium]
MPTAVRTLARRAAPVLIPLGILAAGVLAHVFAVWTAIKMPPELSVASQLSAWDGAWYLELAREGYPSDYARGGEGAAAQSTLAYFPLYPALVRLV